MPNKIQPRPGDGADEKTIEENLKEMDYNPKEDIMRQGDVVDTDAIEINTLESSTEKIEKSK